MPFYTFFHLQRKLISSKGSKGTKLTVSETSSNVLLFLTKIFYIFNSSSEFLYDILIQSRNKFFILYVGLNLYLIYIKYEQCGWKNYVEIPKFLMGTVKSRFYNSLVSLRFHTESFSFYSEGLCCCFSARKHSSSSFVELCGIGGP